MTPKLDPEAFKEASKEVAKLWEKEFGGPKSDPVNHPAHYGGDTPYEVIKVLSAWGLLKNFCLANAVKYIARADKKGSTLDDLKKARWYLDYEIKRMEEGK